MNCQSCRWWKRFKKDLHSRTPQTSGQCRKSVPVVITVLNGAFEGMYDAYESKETVWPKTNQDDWCGEHNEKD